MIDPTYHMLAPAILSTLACSRRTTPNNTVAEQQATVRTLRDRRTLYHTPANMIIRCLTNNYITLLVHFTLESLLRRFACGYNLNTVIYLFISIIA